MTNSLQGAEAGIRREVTLEKSLVSPAASCSTTRAAPTARPTTTVRSGITAYGNVVGSRVVGPVGYTYGQRGSITGSEITGALTLTDAETGPDPRNPACAPSASAPRASRGLTNTGPGAALVAGNWWGCATGLRHHHRPGRRRGRADERAGAAERPGTDARRRHRRARSSTRSARPSSPYGETIYPVVVAADDFGVKSVALTANGLPVATVEPHAVRVRVHARVRAHRRRRHADGDDHRLLGPDDDGLDRDLGARRSPPRRPGPSAARSRRRSRSRSARPRRFGAFTPGVSRIYTATSSATVLSTAGDALLSVVDPSTTAPGHLVNGTFALPQPLPGPRAQRGQHRHHVRHRLRHPADPADVRRPGQQRRRHARVQAADRRQRRAAHRHLREDPDLHAVDDDAVAERDEGRRGQGWLTNSRSAGKNVTRPSRVRARKHSSRAMPPRLESL